MAEYLRPVPDNFSNRFGTSVPMAVEPMHFMPEEKRSLAKPLFCEAYSLSLLGDDPFTQARVKRAEECAKELIILSRHEKQFKPHGSKLDIDVPEWEARMKNYFIAIEDHKRMEREARKEHHYNEVTPDNRRLLEAPEDKWLPSGWLEARWLKKFYRRIGAISTQASML